jgi:hypothetical protein
VSESLIGSNDDFKGRGGREVDIDPHLWSSYETDMGSALRLSDEIAMRVFTRLVQRSDNQEHILQRHAAVAFDAAEAFLAERMKRREVIP